MFKSPKSITIPKTPVLQTWSPENLHGGINLIEREWHLSDNQSNKIVNVVWKDGEISKRWGQEYINDTETVESPCYAAYKYLFMGYIIKHCGTKLYKQDPITGTTTQIYAGLSAIKGSFFKFNGNLYYKQQGNFLVWDGATVSTVTPYTPTIIINRLYNGGGDINENYNRIGKAFINAFITDGAHTTFTLTDANLDATQVVASIDSGNTWSLVEGTDLTVDRVTGVVTMIVAPATNTNVFRIKAYKTDQAAIDSILNCMYLIPFGGQNDNRVFAGGNGTGYYYYTGITSAGVDPTYWAYNNYNIVGLTDEPIYGFGNHYEDLIVLKKRDLARVTYTWDGTKGVFSSAPINSQYGCDCPDSIQNINNALIWLNSAYGVCILVGTVVESQRNAFVISRNINPRLMAESNLTQATSVDFNGKYWLCINDKVYLWDYFISPYTDTGNPDLSAKLLSWWYFDNIDASCFITDGQNLYRGSRADGKTVKFHIDYDNLQFYDFGLGFDSIYRIPLRDFGGSVSEFNVNDMWVDVRGDTKTTFNILYITNDEIYGEVESDPIVVGSFSLHNFSLIGFSLRVMGYKTTFHLQPLEKKIDLFGLEFSNNDGGKDMNISNVVISYIIGKRKK